MSSDDTYSQDFIPTYRPDVWRGVEGRALRDAMIDNGFGETVRAVDALQDVNAAELARIALTVYGTSTDYGASDIPDSIGLTVDDLGSAQSELSAIAASLDDSFTERIIPNWAGDAFASYSAYRERLSRETRDEGEERLVLIGDELLNLAQTIQRTQRDQEITILGGASLMTSAVGIASTAVFGLVLSTVGSLVALGQILQQDVERVASRTEATRNYASNLERPKLTRMQIDDLELPDIDDLDDWEAR